MKIKKAKKKIYKKIRTASLPTGLNTVPSIAVGIIKEFIKLLKK